MDELPILYVYMYRQILNGKPDKLRSRNDIIHAMRKVVHTCSAKVSDEIINELIIMGFINKLNTEKYLVRTNSKLDLSLRRVLPSSFPIIN